MKQQILWLVFSTLFFVLAIFNYFQGDTIGFWSTLIISSIYNIGFILYNKLDKN